jgi:hypothetical protein
LTYIVELAATNLGATMRHQLIAATGLAATIVWCGYMVLQLAAQ